LPNFSPFHLLKITLSPSNICAFSIKAGAKVEDLFLHSKLFMKEF